MGREFVAQIMANPELVKILKSPEQGAATTIYAAISKEWEGKGGKYLEDAEEAKRGTYLTPQLRLSLRVHDYAHLHHFE